MAESEGIFDVQVTNDVLDAAVDKVKNLIMTRLRAKNRVVFVLGGPGSEKVRICVFIYIYIYIISILLCVCACVCLSILYLYYCVCVCVYLSISISILYLYYE